MDGTPIPIDQVDERNDDGHHLWYSGKQCAADGVPTLADKGSPVKRRELDVGNQSYNKLLTGARAIGARANAELKERWRCLRRIRLCPKRISTIVVAALRRGTR